MDEVKIALYATFVLVGLLTGWLADTASKAKSFGRVADLVGAAVGAVAGGCAFSLLAIRTTGWFWPLMCALGGAMLVLVVLRLVKTISN